LSESRIDEDKAEESPRRLEDLPNTFDSRHKSDKKKVWAVTDLKKTKVESGKTKKYIDDY